MRQRYDPKYIHETGEIMCALGTTCQVTFEVKEDMDAPIYVYYEIENFYQNHRDYLKSMYWPQLHWLNTKDKCESDHCVNKDNINKGEYNYNREYWEELLKSNCKPLWKNEGRHLSPCGVVPNTMFDDTIRLNSIRTTPGISMREDKIAWKEDVNNVFQQPLGFDYAVLPGSGCVRRLLRHARDGLRRSHLQLILTDAQGREAGLRGQGVVGQLQGVLEEGGPRAVLRVL